MEKGHYTRQEIQSQPEAWCAALTTLDENRRAALELQPQRNTSQVIFTGCGSTYYLAMAAAALTQKLTGCACQAFPASELWLYPGSCYRASSDQRTLLVAISRSGETSETLHACQAFLDEKRGEVLTLSCYGEMPLARMGTVNIVLPSGQEQSVAQTRAFSTLYLATTAIATTWAGRPDLSEALKRLPEAGRRLMDSHAPLAADLGGDAQIDRFYWLGSGPRYGLACELSLKMKEMSLSHSEPFHFLEFRHGPKSMITPDSLVIGLRSSANKLPERAVLEDMVKLGGRILEVGEDGNQVRFGSSLDEAIHNVLYLPIGQMIAFERALSKGLNPDRPTNLDSVVKL